MSHSLPFISANFYLQRVTSEAPAVVRVRFTHDPKKINATNANDALNPLNYTLTGPHVALVTGVNPVTDDPQAVDVYVNVPLAAGLWTLDASTTIEMEDGTQLGNPSSLLFGVSAIQHLAPANGGAVSDRAADIIRKHLPVSFVGKAWNALIHALALGDSYNWENAILAFDQLFKSSASGTFLDRKASDEGVQRPANIGMPDDLFRRYAIKTSAKKLTIQSILEVLEVFYGTDAVRAYAETGLSEPFRLEDEQTLRLVVDGKSSLEVSFVEADFSQIGRATAAEVANIITRQARAADMNFIAIPVSIPGGGKKVRIYSTALGLISSVAVVGGLAQNALEFPEKVDLNIPIGTEFSISVPSEGVGRYEFTSFSGGDIFGVTEGDVVNITCQTFQQANRGSFRILKAETAFNGVNFEHVIEVENPAAEEQLGPLETLTERDILFFRSRKETIQRGIGRTVTAAQTSSGGIDVVLPATTQAVGREEKIAAYLHSREPLEVESVLVGADGLARVTTVEQHSFAIGDHVILDSLYAGLTPPAVVAGNNTSVGNAATAATAQTSLITSIRAPDGIIANWRCAGALLSGGDVLFVGGHDGSSARPESARLRFLADTILNTGPAAGRRQKHYEWVQTADCPIALTGHQLVAFRGMLGGKAVVLGGTTNGTAATATALIFDPTGIGGWGPVNGSLDARYDHTATLVKDVNGEDTILIVGGLLNTTTGALTIQTLKPVVGIQSYSGEAAPRFRHRAVAISETALVVAGGRTLGSPDVRDDGFIYDLGSIASIGRMSTARYDHCIVTLDDGRVLVVGGTGRNLTNEGSNRVLAEAEILDPVTKRWSPAGRLRYARTNATAMVVDGRVYVMGGLDASNQPVLQSEVYDPGRGSWSVCPSTATSTTAYSIGVDAGGILAFSGSFNGVVVSTAAALFMPGADRTHVALNGQVRVSALLGANSFGYDVDKGLYAYAEDGVVTPVAAEAGGVAGPYVWNPVGDCAVTAVDAELAQSVRAGQQYRSLKLSTATNPSPALVFPEAQGWLVLAYGTKDSVYPVKYLGRLSDDEILIDYQMKMPRDVPAGAKVTLLAQKGAFVPEHPEQLGSFYLTASSAGRLAAQAAIEDIVGAGRDVNFTVSYPGDKGLAGAGLPATGVKISDKVAVWGGDDLDAELAAAREED